MGKSGSMVHPGAKFLSTYGSVNTRKQVICFWNTMLDSYGIDIPTPKGKKMKGIKGPLVSRKSKPIRANFIFNFKPENNPPWEHYPLGLQWSHPPALWWPCPLGLQWHLRVILPFSWRLASVCSQVVLSANSVCPVEFWKSESLL